MRTGKYELVIVWNNGEKGIYDYSTEEGAEAAELGMRTAFGNQIVWSCVREQLIKGERV